MPIPSPRTNEDKQTFLGRCMADDTMRQEYTSAGQRFAVCTGKWDEHARRRKSEDERTQDKTRR